MHSKSGDRCNRHSCGSSAQKNAGRKVHVQDGTNFQNDLKLKGGAVPRVPQGAHSGGNSRKHADFCASLMALSIELSRILPLLERAQTIPPLNPKPQTLNPKSVRCYGPNLQRLMTICLINAKHPEATTRTSFPFPPIPPPLPFPPLSPLPPGGGWHPQGPSSSNLQVNCMCHVALPEFLMGIATKLLGPQLACGGDFRVVG